MSRPLWLPKGSVRAILALGIVSTTIAVGILWALGIGNAEKAFVGLIGLAGYVMKDYFSVRED